MYNIYILLVFRFLKSTRKGVLSFLSLFSIVGIMIGVSALIIVIGIMNGFRKEIEDRLLRFSPHITIIPNLQIPDYKSLIKKLKSFQNIEDIKEYIILKTVIRANDKMDGIILKAVNEPYSKLENTLVNGSLDIESGVIMGKGLAQKLGVLDGDSIEIFSPNFIPIKFKVSGIVDAGIYDINENFILTSIRNVRKLGIYNLTGFEIYLKNPFLTQPIVNEIKNNFENFSVYTWIDLNKNLFSALELEKLGMFLVVLLITIVASFNIISTLSILSERKIYDIGILRVFGFKSKDILIVFFLLGITIGMIGIIFGNLLGFLISFLITDLKLIKLNPYIYFIDYIPIKLELRDYLTISIFAIIIVFLSSIIPSFSISRIRVLETLRQR
ncbi:MAG: FtsX-like permease family protein [candidate division WOR-3 bacterium]